MQSAEEEAESKLGKRKMKGKDKHATVGVCGLLVHAGMPPGRGNSVSLSMLPG